MHHFLDVRCMSNYQWKCITSAMTGACLTITVNASLPQCQVLVYIVYIAISVSASLPQCQVLVYLSLKVHHFLNIRCLSNYHSKCITSSMSDACLTITVNASLPQCQVLVYMLYCLYCYICKCITSSMSGACLSITESTSLPQYQVLVQLSQ